MSLSLLTHGYITDDISVIVQQVPLTPAQAEVVLAKALELPLPGPDTEILGMHQSDVIIRSAIETALQDMRINPWLLDYVFAGLAKDSLTWKTYGQQSIDAAKDWFCKTGVPIKMVPVLNELELPCITISLVESSEVTSESTIGDINYDSTETNADSWPALTSPFTPKSYLPSSGLMVLNSLPDDVFINPGMSIVDRNGVAHEILEVIDGLTLKISPGVVANFKGAVLKPHKPAWVTHIESSSFRETYRIGCHVSSDPVKLTWLHSVVTFALLRYKEVLLEGRGFERSTIQSSDFAENSKVETEQIFTRNITCTGFVRQYWPKIVARALDGVQIDTLTVSGVVNANNDTVARPNTTPGPDVLMEGSGVDVDSQGWVGNLDELDPARRK